MGFGGIGIWQLVIILVIVIMLFGTKKLRTIGTDLGGALKGFKKAMKDEDAVDEEDDTKLLNESTEEKSKSEKVAAKTRKSDDS